MLKKLIPFLFIAVLVSGCSMNGQDLSKFSHFIYGLKTDNSACLGTFWLVEWRDSVYLVTAGHVVNGWNSVHDTPDPVPETMMLRFRTKTGTYLFLKMATTDIQRTAVHQPFYRYPDIYIARISLPEEVIPEAVNIFKDIDYSKIDPTVAYLYGFPPRPGISFQDMLQWSPVGSVGTPLANIHAPVHLSAVDMYDSVNMYFKMDQAASGGFSGSPLFLKDREGDPYFGGVCMGGDDSAHIAFVVRPDYIRNAIRQNAATIRYLPLKK